MDVHCRFIQVYKVQSAMAGGTSWTGRRKEKTGGLNESRKKGERKTVQKAKTCASRFNPSHFTVQGQKETKCQLKQKLSPWYQSQWRNSDFLEEVLFPFNCLHSSTFFPLCYFGIESRFLSSNFPFLFQQFVICSFVGSQQLQSSTSFLRIAEERWKLLFTHKNAGANKKDW